MDAETANSDTSNTEKPETGEKSQDTTDVSLKRKLETDETEDDNSSKRAKVKDGEDKELGQEDKAVTEAVEDKMEMAEEDKPAQSESTEEKDEEKASGDHTVEEAASESVAASDSAGLTGEIQEKAAESKDEAAEQKATKSIEKDVEEKEKSKVEEDETKVEKVAEQIGTPSRRKLTRKRVGGEQRKVESAKPASSGEDDKSQMEGSNEDEKFQMDGSKEDEKFQMDGCKEDEKFQMDGSKEDEKFQMDDSNEDEKFRMDDSKEDEKFQMDGSNEDEKSQMQEEKNGSESGDGDKAASVKSDGGSDKENLNAGTPVDLSNAGTPDDLSNAGTSDIIMLSDEEEMDKQMTDKQLRRWKRIRRLQAALRNEEAKLVLLKKLRQSQQMPPTAEQPVTSNVNNVQQVKSNVLRQTGVPPPLVRGSGAQQGRPQHLQQGQNRSSSQQGSMRNVQGPPPLVGAQRGSTNNSNGLASQSAHGLNQHSSSNQRNTQQQQPAVPKAATPPVDTQTPAQRQAAAKLALRKQLEKTLLQIPPPKPPAPEMNFIPSLACPDFVLLLGLEEVVNHIIDIQLIARGQKSPDEKFICNPFTCVQCGTDYTPVWKREKPGSKNVICEHCVTWNQKRALKQEHTNRLKSAFVKALQQEQEIERMQAPAATTTASTSAQSGTPPAPASAPSPAAAAAAAASNVAAAMSMNSASFRATAEQLRQQQQLLQQAHQAQLRAGQPLAGLQAGFGARGTFPYSLPFVGNLNKADLQRHQQYLLDMIPRGNMPWKH